MIQDLHYSNFSEELKKKRSCWLSLLELKIQCLIFDGELVKQEHTEKTELNNI